MEQVSFPQVNNQYLDNLINSHKNEFSIKIDKLTDHVIKNKMLEILSLRLSGILPINKYYTLDWSSIEINKNADYIEDFNNKYFSFEKFTFGETNNTDNIDNIDIIDNTGNMDNILQNKIYEQIKNIASISEYINNLDQMNFKQSKKLMVASSKLTNNCDKNVNLFQYALILNGIREFISHIARLYPNSLNYMYDKITKEINKMNFENTINIFVSIVKKYLYKYVLLSKNLLDVNIMNNLLKEYHMVEKNIKCIFWIVYHNELKYCDDIIKLYNIDLDYFADKFNKIVYEFDENEINILNYISNKINFLSQLLSTNVLSQLLSTNVKKKIEEIKKNNDTSTSKEIINNTLNDLIDDEIDSIIKINVTDPDEIIIIKTQLDLSKDVIILNLTLNDTMDVLMGLKRKK